MSRTTTTDTQGRFVFDSLLAGEWILGVRAPLLDSLRIEQLAARVEVRARGTTRATIAIPSGFSMTSRVCGDTVARDSSGFVHGQLRSLRDDGGGPPATVRIQWLEFTVTAAGATRAVVTLDVPVNGDGSYVGCGVPPESVVRVRGWRGGDSTGVLESTIPSYGIAQIDLSVGAQRRVVLSVDSMEADTGALGRVMVARGDASVRGVARGAGGLPLANVRVSVWGTGLEAVTASDGRFALAGLPTGSYLLESRAIGYQPSRRIVPFEPSTETIVNMQLERLITLDTIKVRALRNRLLGPDMTGFEERRERGLGRFLDPQDIEKRMGGRTSDLFRAVSGVRLVPSSTGDRIAMRGNVSGYCTPTVFVDRVKQYMFDGDLDAIVSPMEVRAIEVYPGFIMTPPEFQVPFDECGSIVIWTGKRTL
ncbi:carboxypeptidase regulatory-like domain-containing protein [Gemmatimonas sp.]|uniref:carboxypeptidase regulatory-like domain-containing protein n=1 Tax=Gemmatimonas sp. TaxID=1962908 RepID=UPI00286A8E2F|nr:carboxypeptidase regulatory-like domain-containing protein [Gemmatimonas sp.]